MNDSRRNWAGFWLTYAALAAFFAATAAAQVRRHPVGGAAAAGIFLCLMLLLALLLVPGFPAVRSWAAERLRGFRLGRLVSVNLFVLAYGIYAAGAWDFRWTAFFKVVLLTLPITLFARFPVRDRSRLNGQDIVALLWLALPVLFRQLRGIWNVPLNLDFLARLYVTAVGAWAFVIWRETPGAGYEFRFSLQTLRDALLNFAGFAVLALPVGFALGFIAWNPRWRGPVELGFQLVTIFLFIALPEELFFRGLLQNLLEGSWSSRYGAQAAAAALFGLTHVLHAPFPNWRYVILASIAGWFYGSAWRRSRSLMASSATHALVDAVWHTWFTRTMG